MALSTYDEAFLSPDQQKQVTKLTKQLETNPSQLPQVHQAVEDIRATAGYSGGVEGGEYIKLDQEPEVPEIPDFAGFSENAPEVPNIENDFEWDGGSYETEFKNMLGEVKSQIDTGFEYNSENDEAYQAFRNNMNRMGNRAYQNDMAAASARTGGTESSYGQAVASQSRNQYMQTATDAIPTFRNQALNEYKYDLESKMNLMGTYNDLNQQEYQKYQDEINVAVTQYEMELTSYQNDIDLAEKAFKYEMDQYSNQIEESRIEIEDAWDRTQTLGYVSNQDASILGLEPGTLSEDARKSEDELQTYIKKQEIDLDNYKKELETKMAAERKQVKWELNNLPQSSGGGSGGSNSGGGGSDEEVEKLFDLSSNERGEIRGFEQDLFDEMTDLTDMGTIETIDQKTLKSVKANKWESLSQSEQSNVVNTELESRVQYLTDEIDSAALANDQKRMFINMRKIKVIYDSTWFVNYASGDMKTSKQGFMSVYNNLIGKVSNEVTSTETSLEDDPLANPENTRGGTK